MTQAIGKASMDMTEAMRRYVEEAARGADRIMVSVPVGEVAAQSRQQGQPAQMSVASGQAMELAVNPLAVLPYVQKLLPSLGHVALAVVGGRYWDALSLVLRDGAQDVKDRLPPEQWAKLTELAEILDPRTLETVAHAGVMQSIKKS